MARAPIVLLLLVAAAAIPAYADGDPVNGEALARKNCTGCHEVGPDAGPAAKGRPPSFKSVADDPAVTDLALHVFLKTPHAKMPDLMLGRAEMDDLCSYILSLRGNAKGRAY
jgi:mono/diheme cytochrome c family protein